MQIDCVCVRREQDGTSCSICQDKLTVTVRDMIVEIAKAIHEKALSVGIYGAHKGCVVLGDKHSAIFQNDGKLVRTLSHNDFKVEVVPLAALDISRLIKTLLGEFNNT